MYCKNCREKIDNNATFCPHCGGNYRGNTIQKRKLRKRSLLSKNGGSGFLLLSLLLLSFRMVIVPMLKPRVPLLPPLFKLLKLPPLLPMLPPLLSPRPSLQATMTILHLAKRMPLEKQALTLISPVSPTMVLLSSLNLNSSQMKMQYMPPIIAVQIGMNRL